MAGRRKKEFSVTAWPGVIVAIETTDPKAWPKNVTSVRGRVSGKDLAEVIQGVFLFSSHLAGKVLVDVITRRVNLWFLEAGAEQVFEAYPEARLSASIVVATLSPESVTVTRVGDIDYRINGEEIRPDESCPHGVIDGQPVPEQCIDKRRFRRSLVQTLEIPAGRFMLHFK